MRESCARARGRAAAPGAWRAVRVGVLAAAAVGACAVCPAVAQMAGGDRPSYDARVHDAALRQRARAAIDPRTATKAATIQTPGLRVTFHESLGAPTFIRSTRAYLREPDGASWFDALAAFVDEHVDVFGFDSRVFADCRTARDYVTAHNGVRHVTLQQTLNGHDVFGAELRANFSAGGALINVASTLVPAEANTVVEPQLSISEAIAAAEENIGVDVANPPSAQLVYFPLTRDELRPAWHMAIAGPDRGDVYAVTIDATNAAVLHRWNQTAYAASEFASYRVFAGDSPSPYSPGSETPDGAQPPIVPRTIDTLIAYDSMASPNGWIDDGVNETRGNNVHAHTDLDGNNSPDLPRPAGNPYRVFDFALDLSQPPASYAKASVVQVFYWANLLHDLYYQLGFDEASGNFQTDNFGRGGLGGDALQADAQDGSGVNNANITVPADGSPPRMQMFVFDGPAPDRDAAFDAEIVIHEYTHGLSIRLHEGLTALQSRGLGEGWSDFYPLSLLSEAGDDVQRNYAFGAYASYQLAGLTDNYYFGIRRFPYSTRLEKNPLTFADIDPFQMAFPPDVPRSPIIVNTADAVHNIGEVWCTMLWQCRANLIETIGFEGNAIMLQLVTDAMKLSPPNPTFIDARDALLQADLVNYGGAHQCALWEGFAARGLGLSASAPGASTTVGVVEAFDVPAEACLDGRGTIRFDAAVYRCEGNAAIVVTDSNSPGGVTAEVWSTSGDAETITLAESAAVPGEFHAAIQLTNAPSAPGDGTLTVADGGALTAFYADEDDGFGNAFETFDDAAVDCAAPMIAAVNASAIGSTAAVVQLETDELAQATVYYGSDCAVLDRAAVGALGEMHHVTLTELDPLSVVYFALEVTDEAGNAAIDDNGGACYSFVTPEPADYFTQPLAGTPVAFQRLRFTPDGSADFYAVCRESVSAFPVPADGAARLFLNDDDYERVDLAPGRRIPFYGTEYASFYVSSNGYVTFGGGDFDRSETLEEHFGRPRIAGLYDDLNPPRGGEITVLELEDRAVVTFADVPEFVATGANSFQIEMYYGGEIALTHLGMTATDGIVGLSAGLGMPADYAESDLAGYAACAPPPPGECRDGDVNQDCAVTPGDALAAFEHYLEDALLSFDAAVRADVSNPTSPPTVTPADAMCLFEEFLGRASCFGPFPLECSCQESAP